MDYKPITDVGGLQEPRQGWKAPGAVVGSQYCLQKAEQFTLENAVFTKDWSITNANGQEAFRVRGKQVEWSSAKRELVDMFGNTIVIMKEKQWSWTVTWRAFDPGNQERPLWTIRTSSCSMGPQLRVFLPSNMEQEIPDYTVSGDWRCKKCTIYFGQLKVAEVERESSLKNDLMSKSIFHVLVQPGVDTAFIFSLVVITDKIYIHTPA